MEYNIEYRMIVSSKICRLCPIVICDRHYYANILVLENCKFNIILSMKWIHLQRIGIIPRGFMEFSNDFMISFMMPYWMGMPELI